MSSEHPNPQEFLILMKALLNEIRSRHGKGTSLEDAYNLIQPPMRQFIKYEEWIGLDDDSRDGKAGNDATEADTTTSTQEVVPADTDPDLDPEAASPQPSTKNEQLQLLGWAIGMLLLAIALGQIVMNSASPEHSISQQVISQDYLIRAVELLPPVAELRATFPDFDQLMQNENFRRAVFVAVHMDQYPQAFAGNQIEYWAAVYDYQGAKFDSGSLEALEVTELIAFIDNGLSPSDEFTYFSEMLSRKSDAAPFAQYYFITSQVLKPDTAERIVIIERANITVSEVKVSLAMRDISLDDLAIIASKVSNYRPIGDHFMHRVEVATEFIYEIVTPQ